MPATKRYDRRSQDVGNLLAMEHVNVTVPDQGLAATFYVSGLGLTRDPYMMVGPGNMWVNVGRQQFHLPAGDPQVFRGHIGVVVPDLDALQSRLARVEKRLAGTAFRWSVTKRHVAVTCPWGNRLRCHAPGSRFGDMPLGLPYVEIPVEPGAAEGICRFYRDVMQTPAAVKRDRGASVAHVRVGRCQTLHFRETAQPIPAYDGHHVAVYVADFSGPHGFLERHGLITQESDEHQYRFQAIVDPDTGTVLCEIEHEVRSLFHPMYERALVNRNAAQSIFAYTRGRDAFVS